MMNVKTNKRAMWAILAKLYAINSYYAYSDYLRVNIKGRQYNKKGQELPHKPYSLSPLTMEAREHYTMAQKPIWSDETEQKIKAYIMRLRMNDTLDMILDWEKNSGRRYEMNPYRWPDEKRGSGSAVAAAGTATQCAGAAAARKEESGCEE